MSDEMSAATRLERINDLREMLKYERQHHIVAVLEDPTSLEAHILAVSLAVMERELTDLESGVVMETFL